MTISKVKLQTISIGLAAAMTAWAHAAGPDPGYTGNPSDGTPLACATSGCHTSAPKGGPINPAGGSVKALFSTGNFYYSGQSVTITVTITDPMNKNYGFQMTARTDSDGSRSQAGTFTVPINEPTTTPIFVLCQNNSPRRAGATCPTASPVEFIEHSNPSPTNTWQFVWTPTAGQSGAVHFYVAGNAVNLNGQSDGGDHVYTADYVLNPPVCTQVVPTVTSVNSAADFGNLSSFAAGTWLEIHGTNLGQSTRSWGGPDFLYSDAPGTLDGVQVTINSKPVAGFLYVSPTQLNVQAPTDPVNGSAALIVSNCSGTSAAFNVQKASVAPGLFAHSLWKKNGTQYMTALFPDGATYVGSSDLVAGVTLRPAKPGDSITTYGVGFGPVMPTRVPVSGVIVGEQNQLSTSFTLRIGGVDAPLTYFGLAPGFVGLYQFNITVPSVAAGDQPVTGTMGGLALTQAPLFLTITH